MKVELKQDDLEGCAIMFDKIREVYKSNEDIDEHLAENFESHIHTTLELLEQTLFQNKSSSQQGQAHTIFRTKHQLYHLCQVTFQNLLQHYDPRLSEIFYLFSQQKDNLINNSLTYFAKEISSAQEQSHNEKKTFTQEKEKHQQMLLDHQNQIEQLKKVIKNQESVIQKQKKEANNYLQQLNEIETKQTIETHNQRKPLKNERVLGETELKSILFQIFESKSDHSITLEKWLYTYLLRHYGIKNLVIEWAELIFRSLQTWKDKNVFMKIFDLALNHEVTESFLGECILKEGQVKKLLQNFGNQGNEVTQESCQYVLHYMFGDRAVILIDKIKQEEMGIRQLMNIIYNFMCEKFSQKMKPFIQMFKHYDQDEDGVLDYTQFKQLLGSIQEEGAFQKFVTHLDPLNKNQVLFSNCAEYLELQVNAKNIPFLEVMNSVIS